jgi:hypothetical protein
MTGAITNRMEDVGFTSVAPAAAQAKTNAGTGLLFGAGILAAWRTSLGSVSSRDLRCDANENRHPRAG